MLRISNFVKPFLGKQVHRPFQLAFQSRPITENVKIEDFDPAFISEYGPEVTKILGKFQERLERRQAIVGTVVSTKCLKSITIVSRRMCLVPKYNKIIFRRRRFMAHDEESVCKVGDIVRIVPCRPMSRRKRHALKDIMLRPPSLDDDEPVQNTI